MTTQLNLLNKQQEQALEILVKGINREQLIWLNGYFLGLINNSGTTDNLPKSEPKSSHTESFRILYGTHTGKSKTIAEQLRQNLYDKGINTEIVSLDDYKIKQFANEINVVIIISTHGEGEPPAMAEDFYKLLTGKRAPKLPNLNYSVIALGDKSYKYFCKTGIDIDSSLGNSGAKRILPVLTLDLDFENEVNEWINNFTEKISKKLNHSATGQNLIKSATKKDSFSRNNPFFATVIDKVKITGRDSDKEVYHVELSLEDSGIVYEPGDSVGILANNPLTLVDSIIEKLNFSGNEEIEIKSVKYTVREALLNNFEITVLTRDVILKYIAKLDKIEITSLFENEEHLSKYLYGHDFLDLLEEYPLELSPSELTEILRNLPARLYSISSSQLAIGNEVHITVSTVRYLNKGRKRVGVCSGYIADELEIDSKIPVFIEKNPAFKLPENDETPLILVGAGTGVAPYRSFLQQREAIGVKGKTWLFFGERRFHSDFLYQTEWQKLLKNGYLEKIELAFSRDQEQKVYVQHRLQDKQKEIFEWLNKGASLYLCGDMKQMAKDVKQTLISIIENEGGMSSEKASEYLKKLQKEKRFQTDVY